MRSLVIKRKLIIKVAPSRIRARDLDRNIDHPTGSDNIVAWLGTFLGRLNSVVVD